MHWPRPVRDRWYNAATTALAMVSPHVAGCGDVQECLVATRMLEVHCDAALVAQQIERDARELLGRTGPHGAIAIAFFGLDEDDIGAKVPERARGSRTHQHR